MSTYFRLKRSVVIVVAFLFLPIALVPNAFAEPNDGSESGAPETGDSVGGEPSPPPIGGEPGGDVTDPPIGEDGEDEQVPSNPEIEDPAERVVDEEEPVDPSDDEADIMPSAYPTDPLARGFTRLGGADRYGTSVAISKRIFPTGKTAEAVFIASGTSYPDGISMGALASAEEGPLLLTKKNSLPSVVRAEIKRLKPKTIYIAGGTGAVEGAVERELKGLADTVVRLGGINRYATSKLIAEQFGEVETVMLATGQAFPDALVASSVIAKAKGGKAPVLLTPGFKTGPDSLQALATLKPQQVHIVGGKWSEAEKKKIRAAADSPGVTVEVFNHQGADRYATSAALAKHFFGSDIRTVVYATGAVYPDAMSGGPLAKAVGAPILLVKQNCKPTPVANLTGAQNAVAILGGTGALKQSAATTKCPVLPSKVYMSGGYYRFGMPWYAQQTNYWCGPAAGQMVLARIGPTRSKSGVALSQKALASNAYMETDKHGRTLYQQSMWSVGVNRWAGKTMYNQYWKPNTTTFRAKTKAAFTSTGRPLVVDTQEWAWGPHYNGHPRVTISHIMPVEGYNPSTDTIMMLDSAAMYYYGSGAKNLFAHSLSGFTQYLQQYGLYY